MSNSGSFRSLWAVAWPCRIGWHDWDNRSAKVLGEIRICTRCGVRQRLEPDYGGWTSGIWIRMDDCDR